MTPRAAVVILLGAAACNSPAPEAPADTAWGKATVAEELRIGVEFGADEYMFGSIRSIAVAADGTMYVSDAQANIVRVYDVDGVFVREIGRQGQGPGEYGFAPYLQVLDDGTLVMRDSSNSRLSFFSAGGDYLRSFPATTGMGPIGLDPQGNLYLVRGEGGSEVVKYSGAGEELGRVEMPPRERAMITFYLGWGENVYAFPVETVSVWSPLGYPVTGRNDAYDIELRKPDGTIHLQRNLATISLASEEHAEWDVFRQRALAQQRATGREPVDPIPSIKPFFRSIWVGQDGRIWIWRYVAAEKRDDIEPVPEQPDRPLLTWREPWTYDVFEPDATFLGSVVVPDLLRPFFFRGDQIWGAITDQDGVEQVVRLRVVPEAA